MLRLLDIFIFALNCKRPVIKTPQSFFWSQTKKKKKEVYISLPRHEYSQKVKSLLSSWALYPPLTVSWIICPWFISCSRACSCPGCIFNIAEVGGRGSPNWDLFCSTSGRVPVLDFSCISCVQHCVYRSDLCALLLRLLKNQKLDWAESSSFLPPFNLLSCVSSTGHDAPLWAASPC